MSEIGDKLYSLVTSKVSDQDTLSIVKSEISAIEKFGVLDDLYLRYQKVRNDPSRIGNENNINSYVAYILGITTKKPSGELKIEKRRTYGRAGFPDVDMDFDYRNRHLIVDYLKNKYGHENVGNVGTVQTLQTKATLRRVIKALDPGHSIEFNSKGEKIKDNQTENVQLQNEICSTLPKTGLMKKANGDVIKNVEDAYKEFSIFRKYMDTYADVYKYSKKIEGLVSAYGTHAAGVVISPIPLCRVAPLHATADSESTDNNDSKIATQFSKDDVELLGLIKFDILGLATKTAISDAVKLIEENHGRKIDINNLPLDDKPTFRLLSSGKTDGIFQAENYGMQQTLREIGVDCFDDLMAAIAMYRPGPKDFIPEYAKRKKNKHLIKYLHPIVKKYTENTFGVICYQEQIMQIFVEMAGLSPSMGYKFIKGSAKKDSDLFMSMKEQFIKGATANVGKEIAEKVWQYFMPFVGYGFNGAHACSYAYESYITAYLKAHYPLEFMCSRLSIECEHNKSSKFEDIEKYEKDCIKNLGIKIENPDLNKSKLHYTIVDSNTLRRPITSIKGVGEKSAQDIINNQPYAGPDVLFSFITKVGSSVNSKVIDVLYDAGLFGKIKKQDLLAKVDRIRKDKDSPKGDLFE